MHDEGVIATHAAARFGVVLVEAVVEAGVPGHRLEHLRRRGLLIPVGRGVDRMRDHPWTFEARCRAALDLAGPGAALGRRTAARLHTFYRYRDSEEIEVLQRRGRDHRTSIGRVYETRWLPEAHVTEVDGLPATTAARTFFDLAGDPPGRMRVNHPAHERHMAAVYNDCVGRRGLSFNQEAAVLLVLAKRGRSGTKLVRRLLLRFGAEHVPTMSDAEMLFAELVLAYELPEPQRQVSISGPGGFIGVVDFCWPASRLVVEVDSSWHDGPLDAEQRRGTGPTPRRGRLCGPPVPLRPARRPTRRDRSSTGGSYPSNVWVAAAGWRIVRGTKTASLQPGPLENENV